MTTSEKPQPVITRLPLIAAAIFIVIGVIMLVHDVQKSGDWSGGIACFVCAALAGGLSYLNDIGVLPGAYRTKLKEWKASQVK